MKDIDSIRSSVVGEKMLEKAIRHLISLLKVEYDLLIQNRIVSGSQNHGYVVMSESV